MNQNTVTRAMLMTEIAENAKVLSKPELLRLLALAVELKANSKTTAARMARFDEAQKDESHAP